jgi:ubiquinone/menaquinone biosynthesis C-methylase UbiE
MADKTIDFDKAAATWDQVPARVKLAADVGRAIAATVELDNTMDVLDFGCGTGLLTLWLQPHVRSVTGVDSSAGMIDALEDKIKSGGFANIKAHQLDLVQGDTLDEQYSLIVSSMVFHHIEEVEPVLRSLYAALAPGGNLCVADLDPDDGEFHDFTDGIFHQGFDRTEFQALLCRIGFINVTSRTAATVTKPAKTGQMREFSVFLTVGSKQA